MRIRSSYCQIFNRKKHALCLIRWVVLIHGVLWHCHLNVTILVEITFIIAGCSQFLTPSWYHEVLCNNWQNKPFHQ
ncbi:unnamed protein product [Sphagnum balticum]